MEDNNQSQQEQSNTVEISEVAIEQLRQTAKDKMRNAKHMWRQKGAWVKCSSCDYPHALRVTSDKRLIGIDASGMPIFRT